jgi:molybdopterin-containing oxidoreductase family membrane subunit
MAAGLMAIGLEIENPWNMALYGFISPNPLSNIWWKSSLYTSFLLFMTLNFMFLLMNRKKTARIMATVALFAITCGNLNMNADMALLGARGFWAENYMPLFFLLVSTLSACSILVLLIWCSNWVQKRTFDTEADGSALALHKLMIVLVVGMLAFGVMKALGGFSAKFTENPEAMAILVRGDFAINFWIGEIFLAGLLPMLLLVLSKGGKRLGAFALAGLSCAIGISVVFYDLIVVGQLIPHFHEYNLYGVDQFYTYSPTFNEFVIVAGSVSFFFAVFLAGELFFNRTSWKQSA